MSAVENIPQIKTWFYGNLNFSKTMYPCLFSMEEPLFRPSLTAVKIGIKNNGQPHSIIVLQGHPNAWKKKDWIEFKSIIKYLKKIGCSFVLPEEISKNESSE